MVPLAGAVSAPANAAVSMTPGPAISTSFDAGELDWSDESTSVAVRFDGIWCRGAGVSSLISSLTFAPTP